MKRIVFVLLLAIVSAAAVSAQIVRSESHSITVVKKEKPHVDYDQNWLVKAGGGFMVTDNDNSVFGKYSVLLGFQKQFSKNGLYWGAQAGLNSFSYRIWRNNLGVDKSAPALFIGPAIGIKRPLGVNTIFDTHLGVSYARELGSDVDGDDANRVVWELGLGLWYKSFLIELEYQGSAAFSSDHGILLNLGIKF